MRIENARITSHKKDLQSEHRQTMIVRGSMRESSKIHGVHAAGHR